MATASAPRALVVDDDSLCLLTTRSIMERLGMRVQAVSSPAEALSLARAEHFDYIVLDIEMPGLNGYELCRRMREEGSKSRNAFIVALSGHIHDITHVDRCTSVGICDVLIKPVTVEQVHKRLDIWKFAVKNAPWLAQGSA